MAHPDNPGQRPRLETLNLIMPTKALLYEVMPGVQEDALLYEVMPRVQESGPDVFGNHVLCHPLLWGPK